MATFFECDVSKLLTLDINILNLNTDYYREQLEAKEDMLARTTKYLLDAKNELSRQNELLTDVTQSLFESIDFANLIQTALLPDPSVLHLRLQDCAYRVINKIGIGGDSVFIKESGDNITFGLFDATGHGIPASMLSISGLLMLNELLARPIPKSPQDLLKELNIRLHATFNLKRSIAHLEGTIFTYNPVKRKLEYSCAKGKGVHISAAGGLTDLQSCRYAVGEDTAASYQAESFNCSPGDKLFLYSDGLTDQFGGERNKKFSKRRLKEMLQDNSMHSATQLSEIVYNAHLEWKGSFGQTDDVSFLVISF